MCTLSSFVKQGTLAELEIDKTGEEQHRVLQARLSQQQPLKKKIGKCCLTIANTTSCFFLTNIYFFWNLAEKFLKLRKSTRQLMKQALRLLLPAFVLSYKLPYKESYCYKAGKWLLFSEPLLCLICFRFLQPLPSFSIPFLFYFSFS